MWGLGVLSTSWWLGLLLFTSFEQAVNLFNQGEYLRARQEFQTCISTPPKDSITPWALLYLARLEPDPDRAGSLYQRIVAEHPDSPPVPQALIGWAKIRYALADYPGCIALLNRLDESRLPDSLRTRVIYWLGWAHQAAGDELIARQRFGPPPESPSAQRKPYTIQVGSFRVKENALAAVRRLSALGYQAWIEEAWVEDNHYYRVRVGEFGTWDEARTVCGQLQTQGIGGTVVRR